MVELEESYIVSKAHFVCHKVGPCGPSKRTGLVRGVLYTFFLWQEQQFREKPQQWSASTPPRLPWFPGCFWTGNSDIECQKGSLTWTYYTSYMLQESCFSFACTAICYFFQVPVFGRVVFCKLLPWEPRNASRSGLRHMETIVWWQPQNMRATFN